MTIEKHKMNWTNGILTSEIKLKLLNASGYWYYVLIGPDGRIEGI